MKLQEQPNMHLTFAKMHKTLLCERLGCLGLGWVGLFPKTSPKLGSPLGFGVQGLACELRSFGPVGARWAPGGLPVGSQSAPGGLPVGSFRLREIVFFTFFAALACAP